MNFNASDAGNNSNGGRMKLDSDLSANMADMADAAQTTVYTNVYTNQQSNSQNSHKVSSASAKAKAKQSRPSAKPYNIQRSDYYIQKIRMSLNELPVFCADYLRSIASNTTPLTRLAYIGDIKTFLTYLVLEIPKFAGKSIGQLDCKDMANIKKRDIDMYLEYLELYMVNEENISDISDDVQNTNAIERVNTWPGKQRKLSTVRSLFNYLYKEELIPANTAELVDMPKTREKPIIRLEPNEMLDLLDTAESGFKLSDRQQKYHNITRLRDMAMLMVMLGTGIRVGECVGINIYDLDFTLNAMLITRKGDKEMILYFSDEVAQALKQYLDQRNEIDALPGHEDALFLSIQRRRMTVRAVEKMVKKYAQIAVPLKRKISPHKLRSTFGTNLYRETGDIYLVADVLGHSDVNTTRRHYADQSDESRRLAARTIKLREE